MEKTTFQKGDIVFKTDDLKKVNPIKISSVKPENGENVCRGCHANAKGKMVYTKYRESELIAAK
ncbi:hypothetical protein [Draconibacterium halophilum]|uniref:Uncharacterized protein n=1 Tax=Draconibacterium halophilum TaxID=2706887 RepID=A0A6C0R9R2_9BACT|nr:hypothetical protein [Draconibacterium halophilum]QIA06435.1 hypothetical protein G0Q07_01235 [Draconibacterium halophilum]